MNRKKRIERQSLLKAKAFSLMEMLLVLGIGTGIITLSFMINKVRQESLAVEEAKRQIIIMEKSLSSVRNTLKTYSPMISATGLTEFEMKSLFPKEVMDLNVKLSGKMGAVDVRSVNIETIADSYAISYSEVSAHFCAQLGSQVHNLFSQIRLGSDISLSDKTSIAWQKSEEFKPNEFAKKCSELSGSRVIQFISEPIKWYKGAPQSQLLINNSNKNDNGSNPQENLSGQQINKVVVTNSAPLFVSEVWGGGRRSTEEVSRSVFPASSWEFEVSKYKVVGVGN